MPSSSKIIPHVPPTPVAAFQKTARLRVEIPTRYYVLEPAAPLRLINDDPVFDTYDTAQLLGVSRDQLKKWRQRHQGPNYYQYGENGPIRYPLSALRRFQADSLIYPNERVAREYAYKLSGSAAQTSRML